METKVCRRCRKEFPATEEYFYKAGNKRVGLRAICKKCNYLETKEPLGNKKKYKYERVKWENDKRSVVIERLYRIKQNYKVEPEVIMEFMDKQKGCCAICGNSLVYPNSRKSYHIDHCHNTDVIRGLLCSDCNKGIGFLKDNPDIILKALNYLL